MKSLGYAFQPEFLKLCFAAFAVARDEGYLSLSEVLNYLP